MTREEGKNLDELVDVAKECGNDLYWLARQAFTYGQRCGVRSSIELVGHYNNGFVLAEDTLQTLRKAAEDGTL
jgi:hypothetical protein